MDKDLKKKMKFRAQKFILLYDADDEMVQYYHLLVIYTAYTSAYVKY